MAFVIWCLVYFSNSYYMLQFIPAYISQPMVVFILILYCFITKRKFKIKKHNVFLLLLLFTLQLITIIINGFSIIFDSILMASLIIGLLFISCIDFNEFIDGFQKGLIVISSASLVIFLVNSFIPIKNIFPAYFIKITNNGSNDYFLLNFFAIQDKQIYTYYRNRAIFSEPGQFAIFLSIGLIIELFYKNKPNIKTLLLIIVSFVTANSTNGFIVMLFIIIAYLLNKSGYDNKIKKYIRRFLILLSFCTIIYFVVNGGLSNNFISSIIDKLNGLKIDNYSYTDKGTGLERRRAFDVAIKCFLQNPITGLGFNGMGNYLNSLSDTGFIMTFSPLNWFARFGIIYGVVANTCYYCSLGLKPQNKISKAVLMFSIFLMISSQAVGSDLVTSVLIFYGYNNICQIINVFRKNKFDKT